MTLTEVKNKITEELGKYTIDDFYASQKSPYPNFTYNQRSELIRNAFFKILQLKSEDQIIKYFKKIISFLSKEIDTKSLHKEDWVSFWFLLKTYETFVGTISNLNTKKILSVKNIYNFADEKYDSISLQDLFTIKNVIPINWRKLIYKIISTEKLYFTGTLGDEFTGYKYNISRFEKSLNPIDKGALIALKNACKNNSAIMEKGDNIILDLSGGIIANISFREKGKIITDSQTSPFELFYKTSANGRFTSNILYNQTGYASSSLEIETPLGYYILTEDYVIEIGFEAAAMLNNSNPIGFVANISSSAKIDNELAEQEEEERKRLDDLLWDDLTNQ